MLTPLSFPAREDTLPDASVSVLEVAVAALDTPHVHLVLACDVSVRVLLTTHEVVVDRNGRQGLVRANLVSHVPLVLNAGQLRQGIVPTVVHFLPPVNVLNVPSVLNRH